MADGLYVGMNGAAARAQQLESIADNLANASTPGFKAGRAAFGAFLPESGAEDKSYAATLAAGFDLRPGFAMTTGRALDVLPQDGAFLAVRGPDGSPAYTRDGHVEVTAEGLLTIQGAPLLSERLEPIYVPENATVQLAEDGTVLVDAQPVERLARFQLQGPLQRVGSSKLAPQEGGSAVPVDARLTVGQREASNASALESAVLLVNAQRHFESAMQALQTYRRLDERASEVGRVR